MTTIHITVAMKPTDTTFLGNLIEYGVSGLHIDDCRVGTDDNLNGGSYSPYTGNASIVSGDMRVGAALGMYDNNKRAHGEYVQPPGRYPANIIHDGSDDVVVVFPITKSGHLSPHHMLRESTNICMSGPNQKRNPSQDFGGDSGSASRFFKNIANQNETAT